jgi:hypothetical protein
MLGVDPERVAVPNVTGDPVTFIVSLYSKIKFYKLNGINQQLSNFDNGVPPNEKLSIKFYMYVPHFENS